MSSTKSPKSSGTEIAISVKNSAQFHRWLWISRKTRTKFVKSCSKFCWHDLKYIFKTFCESYQFNQLEIFCSNIVFWKNVWKKPLFFLKSTFCFKNVEVDKNLTFVKSVKNVLRMFLATRRTSFYKIYLCFEDKINATYEMEHVFYVEMHICDISWLFSNYLSWER